MGWFGKVLEGERTTEWDEKVLEGYRTVSWVGLEGSLKVIESRNFGREGVGRVLEGYRMGWIGLEGFLKVKALLNGLGRSLKPVEQ